MLCLHVATSTSIQPERTDEQISETLPLVQIKLAPPKRAFPEVSAETSRLEHDRVAGELAFGKKLQEVYQATLHDARVKIQEVVLTAMHLESDVRPSMAFAQRSESTTTAGLCDGISSNHTASHTALFLGKNTDGAPRKEDAFAVKVAVATPHGPDPSIRDVIDKIELKRSQQEGLLFQLACAELPALTMLVLRELEQGLSEMMHTKSTAELVARKVLREKSPMRVSSIAFLHRSTVQKSLPAQANIRLAASPEAFPRIRDLIQNMELRRDTAEIEEQVQILNLEMHLLKAEHDMIHEAIEHALGRTE